MNVFGWLAADRRRAWAALALLAAVGLPLHVAIKRLGNPELLKMSAIAPALQGPTLAGGAYDSLSDRGKMVVVAFLDPSTGVGVAQGRAVMQWRALYADGRAAFVIVTPDLPPERLAGFADAHNLPRDSLVIDRGGYRARAFKARGDVTVYVIDPIGAVRFAHAGLVKPDNPSFRDAMWGFLNQIRPPIPSPALPGT